MEQSDVVEALDLVKTPKGSFVITEELSQAMRGVVLFLSGFIASMPEGVEEEAHKDVFGAIDTMVADTKAHNEYPAPEA